MRAFIVLFVTSVSLLVACGRPCATARCPEQCVDEAGRSNASGADLAPAQQGACGSSVSCSSGCTCNGAGDGGTPSCLCTGAIPPNPGFLCVPTPTCGIVSCGTNCSCADAGASVCACN